MGSFQEYLAVSQGLNALREAERRYADSILQKLALMQQVYLRRHSGLYDASEVAGLRYYLAAVCHKFHLASLSLEQLWALSHTTRNRLFDAISNSLDSLDTTDDELLFAGFALEAFLFQARAFLSFYMIYLCRAVKTGHTGSMTRERFFRRLDGIEPGPLSGKAALLAAYFRSHVFAESDRNQFISGNWGSVLVSLRDKITHRDRLRPSFESDERLLDRVLFDWPTLRGITYDRFCQDMQNGMFALFTDLSPVIYELEWQAGPCRPGTWGETA